jgi:hypothetical protein
MSEFKGCPFCGGIVQWCDFDGEKVSGECCDIIVCTTCPAEFQFSDTSEHGRETLAELQVDNLKVFNTRYTTTPLDEPCDTPNCSVCAFLKKEGEG